MVTELLLLLAVLVGLVWALSSPFHWRRKGVPSKVGLPLIGNCTRLFKIGGLFGMLDEMYKEYKGRPYFGIHLFTKPFLILTSPSVIQEVMVKHAGSITSHGFYMNPHRDPVGANLFFMEGSQWREVRGRMSPYFTTAKIKQMVPYAQRSVEPLVKWIESKAASGPVEIRNSLLRFTIDVLTSSTYGIGSDALHNEESEFVALERGLFNRLLLLKLFVGSFSKRVYDFLRFTLLTEKSKRFFLGVVSEVVSLRKRTGLRKSDFLQGMIEVMDEVADKRTKGDRFPDGTLVPRFDLEDITAHLVLVFAGGTETSATSVAFSLYELALNQEMQERARAEAQKVMEAENGAPSYQALHDLEYVNLVISEALRKYPTFNILNRRVTEDVRLEDGLVLEKGTLLMVPVFSIHRDPDNFPEPEKFVPERFSEERKGEIPPNTYIPFGLGPKICLGMKFARAEMLLVLVHLLSKFRFDVSSKTNVPMELSGLHFLTSPRHGIWLRVEPLSPSPTSPS